jgi:hypothetical protein
MKCAKFIAKTLLVGFTLSSPITALKASAEPITVARDSHGAALIVNSDKTPVDAKLKSLPNSPNRSINVLGAEETVLASTVTTSRCYYRRDNSIKKCTFTTVTTP